MTKMSLFCGPGSLSQVPEVLIPWHIRPVASISQRLLPAGCPVDSEHTAVTVKEPSGDDRQVIRQWKCRLVNSHGGCLEEALERALPWEPGYVKYDVSCLRQWFLALGNGFLSVTQKHKWQRNKSAHWTSSELNTFPVQRKPRKTWKDNTHNGRNYLQIV